jgi:hypothetical protein
MSNTPSTVQYQEKSLSDIEDIPAFKVQESALPKIREYYAIWSPWTAGDQRNITTKFKSYEGKTYALKWWISFNTFEAAEHQAKLWQLDDYIIEGVKVTESRLSWIAATHTKSENNE